jgi:hypothetical protein
MAINDCHITPTHFTFTLFSLFLNFRLSKSCTDALLVNALRCIEDLPMRDATYGIFIQFMMMGQTVCLSTPSKWIYMSHSQKMPHFGDIIACISSNDKFSVLDQISSIHLPAFQLRYIYGLDITNQHKLPKMYTQGI